ncbi:MAG: ribosomal protein S18-alanine N-acetyltransferase [Candidatus Acidiferrum sp.]
MAVENRLPSASVEVRSFRAEDADAVVAISEESPNAANWPKESYLKLAAENDSLLLVIETGGRIAAFLIGRRVADQAEILNLAVKQAHRRKGLGSALMSAALKEFALRGAKSVYLEVRQSNTVAIAFYERLGFAKSGLRKAYYRAPDESAVTMTKELSG